MSFHELAFVAVPYAAVLLAVVGTVYRFRYRKFTVSSLSSQLLERSKLYWGSIPFHWGIVIILGGHLLALIIPASFTAWNSVPVRLYALEITGFALGLWALVGLIVLLIRRMGDKRIRAVTTPMDLVVLGLLGAQVVTGLIVAGGYRFGSFWGPEVFTPYLRSLFVLDPRPELLADLAIVIRLHAFLFFVFLAVFPFTRLVHIVTVPLQYIFRPWQRRIFVQRDRFPRTQQGFQGTE
jgi:nitrate reductase gamma subunit